MYKRLVRPVLFCLSPETVHHLVTLMVKFLLRPSFVRKFIRSIFSINSKKLERNVFGLRFPNPVGLAAGFDKDASFFKEFDCFGFGFIEVGTITPRPQPGNPAPRMFRLPKDKALINRMGFNNMGVEVAKMNLSGRDKDLIIGGNIGKNKTTPNSKAVDDYLVCFRELHPYVDYFVVNVSSPNTPGLRELQEKEPLMRILKALKTENASIPEPRPILLKIAPDLTDRQLDDIVTIVQETGIEGVVATNTTISRSGLNTTDSSVEAMGPGGLSGRPLKDRSTEVIRYLHQKSGGSFPIIGTGGIHSPQDAMEKLEAGATLLQVYTGFIYEGPMIIKRINKAILEHQSQNGAGTA